MRIVPVSEGPGHRFGGVGNVLVSLYWAAPEAAALRERIPWVERTIEKHGHIALLVVITADADGGLPDRAFRDESKRQAEKYRDAIVLSASALEGAGVLKSLVRTFLRTLAMAVAKDIDVRFFETASGAAQWVAAQMAPHGGPSAEDLESAVEALRALGPAIPPEPQP